MLDGLDKGHDLKKYNKYILLKNFGKRHPTPAASIFHGVKSSVLALIVCSLHCVFFAPVHALSITTANANNRMYFERA